MLNPPDGLRPDMLATALSTGWGLSVASARYRAVGFGSHHWEVVDSAGRTWFVTADELAIKRKSLIEPLDAVFGRLRAALATVVDLADLGLAFVVAPVTTSSGEPLVRLADRFTVALYPFQEGKSYDWGAFCGEEHRLAVLDLVVALHTAPPEARARAVNCDLEIDHRDELDLVLDAAGRAGDYAAAAGLADSGPYGRKAADLVAAHAGAIGRLRARCDELAAQIRSEGEPLVLTHGEPHPGNTMLTAEGWKLIDWDTAAAAPPERDLWDLDPGDGSVLARYQRATGITPRPAALELFRRRWDLADLAVTISGFRAPHTGDANDDESFELLRQLLAQISR